MPGWEGVYEVSSLGRVRSLPRTDHLGRRVNGRMLKNTKHNAGYWMVRLVQHPRKESHLVHRLVARAAAGVARVGVHRCGAGCAVGLRPGRGGCDGCAEVGCVMSDFDPVMHDIREYMDDVWEAVNRGNIPQIVANELRRLYTQCEDPGLYFLVLRAQELEQL